MICDFTDTGTQILFSCSDHQEQETALVLEDDPQADVKLPIDDFFECPSEPVSLVNLEVMTDATEVILNSKSQRFGRVFRDYRGCFVRLSEPCTTQIGLQKPSLRVECPSLNVDPIFTKCQGTIERVNDSVEFCLHLFCHPDGRSFAQENPMSSPTEALRLMVCSTQGLNGLVGYLWMMESASSMHLWRPDECPLPVITTGN